MAKRFVRKMVALFKAETTEGVDANPSASTDALLLTNVEFNIMNVNEVPRKVLRQRFGARERLPGTRYIEISFGIEFQGSGALGTAPPMGAVLKSSGFAETITASQRVTYNTITDSLSSGTLKFYDDGVQHIGLGCRGDWSINAPIGEIPELRFKMYGLYVSPTAVSNPAATLTAFKPPLVVTDANSGDITLGCTYATGALSGGTSYPSLGITLEGGQVLNHNAMLGQESIDISDREITGHISLDLTAAQEVSMLAAVEAGTLQSIGWAHGTTAGLKQILFMPKCQLRNPKLEEVNGKRLVGFDISAVEDTGNDELQLVFI